MFQTMIGSFEMEEVDAWRWTFQEKTASVESDFEAFIAKLHEDMEETFAWHDRQSEAVLLDG